MRTLDIHSCYVTTGEKILNDFLIPVLNKSKYYNRITSFYTIESLLAISQGIEHIYKVKGKMRLIVGIHSVPDSFAKIVLNKEQFDKEISKIRKQIEKDMLSIHDALEKKRLATIAWMIEDGLLEVKAVMMKSGGIFHPKTLIFKDDKNNEIAAMGSPNETRNGLGGNFEQLMVFKSWNNPEGIEEQKKFFNQLWNNELNELYVSDITKELATVILNGFKDEYQNPSKIDFSNGIIHTSSCMPANFFVSGDIPALYMHQERAVIDALSRWPVRVLFSDEVGLGKTFEAAATLVYLIKYCGVKRVVILTPKAVLKQWQDELYNHFGLDVWLYDSSKKQYASHDMKVQSFANKNPLGADSPNLILMSAQFARGKSQQVSHIFDKAGSILPDLLIVDEAHSARVSKDISGHKKKTKIYSMLESVSKKIPHIILATATPMLKDTAEYHELLKLLGLPIVWKKERIFDLSLNIIGRKDEVTLSEAANAGRTFCEIVKYINLKAFHFSKEELVLIAHVQELVDSNNKFELSDYVLNRWSLFKQLYIKLHPGKLLTVRNTRRSLINVGYKFPERILNEINIQNSDKIELYYHRVNEYITNHCFSIECAIDSEKKINTGFVKVGYQQRVASSLYSCRESLQRRLDKVNEYKQKYLTSKQITIPVYYDENELDEFDDNVMEDTVEFLSGNGLASEDVEEAIITEKNDLSTLIEGADDLLSEFGDLKITTSIQLVTEKVEEGFIVLVFSRYADTVNALIKMYEQFTNPDDLSYGTYTGSECYIKKGNVESKSNKEGIKEALFNNEIKVLFCTDAASEGLNLQAAQVLINVDVPWTPARLEQRIGRIARLGQKADEVYIYNVWYPHSIEAKMYHRIQSRLNATNLAIGEFPEIIAQNILKNVLNDVVDDKDGLQDLQDLRNSTQVNALKELWINEEDKITYSSKIRANLMKICDSHFPCVDDTKGIKTYLLPNGKTARLTNQTGLDETISLKSSVWEYFDFMLDGLKYKEDGQNRPVVFCLNNKLIKYESILDEDFELNKDSIMISHPVTIPNFDCLDMSYAIEGKAKSAPVLWVNGSLKK